MAYLRLISTFVRVAVMNELTYLINFFVQVGESVLRLGTALAGLAVVFYHTETLGDWRPAEILALVGIFLLVRGAVSLMIIPSLERLIDDVRQGTLDFTLTKPEDAQLLISVRQIQIWQLADVMLGLGVLGVALVRLGGAIGAWEILGFVGALLAGAAIVYSFLLSLATTSFWLVRIENLLTIFWSMYEAGRWPVAVYPRWLRWILTFLVPIVFAISIPAEALTGRLTESALLGTVGLAVALLVLSRWFWRVGLRYYSGASA